MWPRPSNWVPTWPIWVDTNSSCQIDLVGAERAAGRRAGDHHHELTRAEQGHLGVVLVAELVDLALVGLGERPQHDLGLGVVVGRAGLVVGAPQLVRPPFAAERRVHLVAVDPGLAGAALPVVRRAVGPGDAGRQDQRASGRKKHPCHCLNPPFFGYGWQRILTPSARPASASFAKTADKPGTVSAASAAAAAPGIAVASGAAAAACPSSGCSRSARPPWRRASGNRGRTGPRAGPRRCRPS